MMPTSVIAHLVAGPLFLLSLHLTKFALERHLILDYCASLEVASCSDPAVTAAVAMWLRWVLTTETLCALFTLPTYGAISDNLKLRNPSSATARVPLLVWQLGWLPLVPLVYLGQALLRLPHWVQLVGPVLAGVLGAQINVFMPTWFCVRADIFAVEGIPTPSGATSSLSHIAKGRAFLRMELALISANLIAGLVQQAVLQASEAGSELVALHILYGVAILCAAASAGLIGALGLCIAQTRPAEPTSKRGEDDAASKLSPKHAAAGALSFRELVALRSCGHLWRTLLSAAAAASPEQRRLARWLLLVFAIANSIGGMASVMTVLLSGLGWSARMISQRAALDGAGQLCLVALAMLGLEAAGSVEWIVALVAATSACGWATLATGVALRSRGVQWASALIVGGWGPTIVMTRSMVVLYCPEAKLGTALAFLALLDEAATALGDFTFSTVLGVTAKLAPSTDAWIAAAAMLVCVCGALQLATSDALRRSAVATDDDRAAAVPLVSRVDSPAESGSPQMRRSSNELL